MRAAIFTIDTESYEAKKKSAAGEALKRMLEQNRLEVKAGYFRETRRSFLPFSASWQIQVPLN